MTTVKKKVSSPTYIFADTYSEIVISGPRFSRKAARTALSALQRQIRRVGSPGYKGQTT
jgi:hypothetical protein